MLIDTHCHLNMQPIVNDLEQLLSEAANIGVTRWIVPSVVPDDWQQISQLGSAHPAIWPAFGIHPLYAGNVTTEQLDQLEQLAASGVAIGETGLDGTLGYEVQQERLFREQLRIARRNGLPVLIHCRRAIGRLLEILKEERADETGGIMHAFSGSLESALACIRLGFAISFCGTLTRMNAVKPLILARQLPLEQIVIETDAPACTPDGHGKVHNRPVWLQEVAMALATCRGISFKDVADITSANARRVIPGGWRAGG